MRLLLIVYPLFRTTLALHRNTSNSANVRSASCTRLSRHFTSPTSARLPTARTRKATSSIWWSRCVLTIVCVLRGCGILTFLCRFADTPPFWRQHARNKQRVRRRTLWTTLSTYHFSSTVGKCWNQLFRPIRVDSRFEAVHWLGCLPVKASHLPE